MIEIQYPFKASSYSLLYTFDKGNHGIFWVARINDKQSPNDGKIVCVKIIKLEDFNKNYSLHDQKHEINIISKCFHPNVLKFYTSFISNKELWIVQPLITYGALRQILGSQRKGVQSEAVALSIIKQIALGLAYLHSKNLIHGDLGSANILLGEDGRCLISHFAQLIKVKQNEKIVDFVGNPCYMAPEKIE